MQYDNDTKTPVDSEPVAFLLLSLPDVSVVQVYDGEEMKLANGELTVDCVSLPIPAEIGHQTANPFAPTGNETHDLWLVIKVGDFEHTLVPGNHLGVKAPPGGDGGPEYTISDPTIPNGKIVIRIEAPRSQAEFEDLNSFESLLTQYGSINPEETGLTGIIVPVLIHPPTDDSIAAVDTNEKNKLPPTYDGQMLAPPIVHSTADLRGRLVLVDEGTGAVLGELDSTPSDSKDQAAQLAATDPSQPVLVDFGALVGSYVGHNVTVSTVPQDELDDWIFRGADKVSRSILAFGSWGSQQMMAGADKFKKHTVPRPEPLKVGPTASSGLKTVHAVSLKGARVSKKTVNSINNAVSRIAGGKHATPSAGGSAAYAAPTAQKKAGYTDMLRHGADKLKATVAGAVSSGSRPTSGAASPVGASAPALPPRKTSPFAGDQPPPYDTKNDDIYAEKASAPIGGSSTSQPPRLPQRTPSPGQTHAGARKKRPLLNRTVVAIDAILSASEVAANNLITAGTAAASSAVAHKYGTDAGHATALVGGTVRNVVLVYVDVRGVGRRSLLKGTAKGFVKARLRSGETVRFQPQQAGASGRASIVDHELVVEMPQVPQKK